MISQNTLTSTTDGLNRTVCPLCGGPHGVRLSLWRKYTPLNLPLDYKLLLMHLKDMNGLRKGSETV